MLETLKVTRYVTPLREGGSLPAIVEAENSGVYVLKFRGAGQGPKALIAELVGGEIGRALGLPVPEIALLELDPALGRSEPDYEIRNLILASAGLNLGLDYLSGSLAYDPLTGPFPAPELASAIVWFDALITNVDRTPRNTNLLVWHKKLWLIDHGASLYFHHTWQDFLKRSLSPFPAIKDHVLLPLAGTLLEADARLRPLLTPARLQEIIRNIPETWLENETRFPSVAAHREAYLEFLQSRLENSNFFVEEAINARAGLL